MRLRSGLPQRLLDGDWTYSETVARAQQIVRPPILIVDRATRRVLCGGVAVTLTPVNFAFFAWLADRRQKLGDASTVHHLETSPQDFLRAHTDTGGIPDHVLDPIRQSARRGVIDPELLQSRKNRVNAALTKALGQDETPYHIAVVDLIPGTKYCRYGLPLSPASISFAPVDAHQSDED